jgi:hypothetical protein
MAAPAAPVINVGDRTYIPVQQDFGTINRPSFLGLKDAPVVLMDDNTLVGFAGQHALQDVVPVATGKNFADEPVPVPLDVRIVGIDVMNKLSIASETQAAMFIAFRKLSQTDKKALTDQWEAANAGTDQNKADFVNAMIAQLTAAPAAAAP